MLHLKCTNSISAGALPQIPLGKLTSLPRPPSWILGKGGERRKGNRERERGRTGYRGLGSGNGKRLSGRNEEVRGKER